MRASRVRRESVSGNRRHLLHYTHIKTCRVLHHTSKMDVEDLPPVVARVTHLLPTGLERLSSLLNLTITFKCFYLWILELKQMQD